MHYFMSFCLVYDIILRRQKALIPPLLLDHQSERIFVNISFQIPSD